MSKYVPLWEAVAQHGEDKFQMSFAEVEQILGFPIDHSFLNYKKELTSYGWQVGKISLKARTVSFERYAAPETEYHNTDALLFFDGRPDALPLYMALTDRMEKTLPEFQVKVQKSQISFYNRHLFAMVSLPRRKSERGLMVSFGLGYRLDSPRVDGKVYPI